MLVARSGLGERREESVRVSIAIVVASVAPLLLTGAAPETPPVGEDGRYEYRGSVEVEGVGADTLLERAAAWTAEPREPKSGWVRRETGDAGLVLDGTEPIVILRGERKLDYTLTLAFEDGRCRYLLSDFRLDSPGWRGPVEDIKLGKQKTPSRVHRRATTLLESLREALTTP